MKYKDFETELELETKAQYTRVLKVTSPLMYGDDVRAVQNKLNSLGYNAGTADGYYGNNTKDAVIRFQKAKGLTADGMVGKNTWNALFGSSSSGSGGYTRVIKLTSPYMYGEDVKSVQRKLNNLKYNAGTVDGYFGPSGERATKDFQRINGLSVDGMVGKNTWNKLFSTSAKPNSSSGTIGPLKASIKSTAPISQMSMTVHKGGTLYKSDYVMNATGYYGQTKRWFKNDKWDDGSTREIFYGIKDANAYVSDIKTMIDDYIDDLTDILGIAKDKVKDKVWDNIKKFLESQVKNTLENNIDTETVYLTEEDLELAKSMYKEIMKDENDGRTIAEIEEDMERALPSIATILALLKGIEFFKKIIDVTKTLYPIAGFAYNTLRSIHHFNKI